MLIAPTTLRGHHVRLEPLNLGHLSGLCAVGLDDAIWHLNPTPVTNAEEMRAYVDHALAEQASGSALPFATMDVASGQVIGSTRFGSIDRDNLHVEIGWTWLGRSFQRTAANTEAKLLMLTHAFEHWRCIRVELKTDVLNLRSRNAMLRIGAKEEGIFRRHMITSSGRIRDSIYFSIIAEEWPGVKAGLEAKLARRVL